MKKIVIIGANDFQNQLILKAKEMGFETHVFAWQDGSIGERTAEEIKIKIGSVHSTDDEDQEIFLEVKGIDLVSRMPKAINISSHEIRAALQVPVTSIVEAVRATLEKCPPELASDLIDRGIMLAGGGSLLRGLDRLISEETGLPVFVADDPLKAVANGTGIVLQEMDNMARAMTLAK